MTAALERLLSGKLREDGHRLLLAALSQLLIRGLGPGTVLRTSR